MISLVVSLRLVSKIRRAPHCTVAEFRIEHDHTRFTAGGLLRIFSFGAKRNVQEFATRRKRLHIQRGGLDEDLTGNRESSDLGKKSFEYCERQKKQDGSPR